MPGMGMSRFLDRIGGSAQVRDGLLEAFAAGVSVTARVTWLAAAPRPHEFSAQSANSARSLDSGNAGRIRWLHCTPLRGADGAIGIWMVVMVENEAVTGRLTRRPQRMPSNASREVNEADGLMTELSIEGGKGSESLIGRNSRPSTSGGLGPNKARYYDIGLGLARPGLSLYADYLRRDSRSGSAEGKFADLSNSDKQTQ